MSSLVGAFDVGVFELALRIVGLSILSAVVVTVAAATFRLIAGDRLPEGIALLVGLGAVALYLNTRLALVQFIGNAGDPLRVSEAAENVLVFLAAGFAAGGGLTLGDRIGSSDQLRSRSLQLGLSPLVRATGRFITVKLPDDIRDVEGYDPVPEETKAALTGLSLDFPRRLTVDELETQLADRLTEKHDVGYVDVELGDDGAVEYLAVGQRAAGLGPTLPPGSAAVAVQADPAFSASPGDTVEVWHREEDGTLRRVTKGELRATAGRVATIATGERGADAIDPTAEYRLLTLSADTHPEREFAAMLRHADETMSTVEVGAESSLARAVVGELSATVVAVESATGELTTLPDRNHPLAAGDTLYALARPEALRKLEVAARGADPDGEDSTASGADDAEGRGRVRRRNRR